MQNSHSPTTNVSTHFDTLTNEWVTTFTIRHKTTSIQADSIKHLSSLAANSFKFNDLPSDLKLPTINQKPLMGVQCF